MKRTMLVVATLVLISLAGASAHAQSINITARQHVFSNVTATPVACESPLGCWTIAGKIAQPELCVLIDDGEGNLTELARVLILLGNVNPLSLIGQSDIRTAAIAGVSPDCSFSFDPIPTFTAFGPGAEDFVTQDGGSWGAIVVQNPRTGIAWEACTGGPCPTASFPNQPSPIANAYITNAGSNTVSVLNTSSNSVTATIPVGPNPVSVAVSPSGSRAYVTNAGSNSVSVIDTGALTVTQNVTVGGNPVSVAITPDGSQVYVANARSNSVSVINTSTNTVSATIPVGFIPLKIAVTPDGASVYVANSAAKSLSVISTSTNSVVATVPVGLLPDNMAIQ